MKKKMSKLLMLTLVLAAMVTFGNESKAKDLPNQYITFVFDTPTSGWLWCGGTGICAQVYGTTIYFGNYVGDWSGAIATGQNDEDGYYVTEVSSSN